MCFYGRVVPASHGWGTCSSPARAAASARPSRCAPRATARTSSSRPRPPSRIRSCRAPSTPRPRRTSGRGGKALPVAMDIRDEAQIERRRRAGGDRVRRHRHPRQQRQRHQLTGTLDTPMKRFDLMHQVNVRGTFVCSQAIPHLRRAANPHILNISPPLNTLQPRWFAPARRLHHGEVRDELCVLGMAEELRARASPSTRCGRAPRSIPKPFG